MMKKNLLAGVVVFSALGIPISPSDLHARSGELSFDRLTTRQGLSENYVNAIIQDQSGFMWFGTQDGLNRYDGYEFTVYRHKPTDPNSLSNSYVNAIIEDSAGTLWIGTANGLNRFDRENESFVRYLHDPLDPASLRYRRVLSIYEDRSGVLWLGTRRGGLHRFDRETGDFQHHAHDPEDENSLAANEVRAIYEDRSGVLWIGTDGGGLNRFDRATETWTRFLPDSEHPDNMNDNEVRAIHEDRSGSLWIGTRGGGLKRFDRGTRSFERQTHEGDGSGGPDYVYSILEDKEGTFWFGTRNRGLYQLDRETGAFRHWMHEPGNPGSLSHNYVRTIYEDRSGLVWVGTKGGGINKLRRQETAWTHYLYGSDVPQSMGEDRITALAEDFSGVLWIATSLGGLYRLHRESGRLLRYQEDPEDPDSLTSNDVAALCEDSAGRLWIASGDSLDRFDRESERFIHASGGAGANGDFRGINALHGDGQGYIWLAVGGRLAELVRFDPETQEQRRYVEDPDRHDDSGEPQVRFIFEGSDGLLWLGTRDGLKRFDPQRAEWTSYRNDLANPRSLSDNFVSAIEEDSLGRLWIGTSGGLNRLERAGEEFLREDFIRFTEDDGLPSNLIYSIVAEGNSLWISSSSALFRFDLRTEKIRTYGEDDGFFAGSFSRSAAIKNRRGEMIFVGERGIVAFRPGEVKVNLRVPPVVLTGFRKFNKKADLGRPISEVREIELSHQDDFISFEFAALDYHFPEKNQYAYQLVGFDKEWVESGTGRTATYTNLDPAQYVFRVRGANHDGVWNAEGLSLRVSVKPPFWETWWFRGMCLLVLVLLLMAGHLVRTRGIRRRNILLKEMVEERTGELRESQAALLRQERLATLGQLTATVSHELRNPLGAIRPSLYTIRKWTDQENPRLRKALERAERSVTRCDHIIDEMLDFTRDGSFDPRPVLLDEWLGDLLDGLSVPDGIEVRRELCLPDLTLSLDPDRFRRAFINVYENACQAMMSQDQPTLAEKRSILTISTRLAGDRIETRVADTGCGISRDALPKVFEPLYSSKNFGVGLGLAIVKDILELHRGAVEVETMEGRGTCVVLRVPVLRGSGA